MPPLLVNTWLQHPLLLSNTRSSWPRYLAPSPCRGARDEFVIEEDANLGKLLAVTIGHDGRGTSPSWHVEKVEVALMEAGRRDTSSIASSDNGSISCARQTAHTMLIFPCNAWLDEHLGDGAIKRRLVPGRHGPLMRYETHTHTQP
jgi:PLAT/LH2 domain